MGGTLWHKKGGLEGPPFLRPSALIIVLLNLFLEQKRSPFPR